MVKVCTKCGVEKELSEFYKTLQRGKLRIRSDCKKCNIKQSVDYIQNHLEQTKITAMKWRENNADEIRYKDKQRYLNNKEKYKEKYKKSHKLWYQNNKEKVKANVKRWRSNNLEKANKIKQEYYKKNCEKLREKSRQYRLDNPEKVKECKAEYYKKHPEKRREYECNKKVANLHYRIKHNVSTLVLSRLKFRLLSKEGQTTFSFFPYTVDELIKHLESLFAPWMNWQNYGKRAGCWCIDHIRPDISFDYKSVKDEEFQKCWALNNLQPLEWMENIKKADKLI